MNSVNVRSIMEQREEAQIRLIENAKDIVLYEDKQHDETLTLEEALDGIEGLEMRKLCAQLCANTRAELDGMSESTRMMNIGSFEKWAFPMVTTVVPALNAHNLVSVQAMPGPVSQVFYMKYIYNASKGSAVAGQDIFENPNAYYASETIDEENIGTGDNSTVTFTGNLAYTPIRPGTIRITFTDATAKVITDDGNGNLVGDVDGTGNNTIVYATGAFDLKCSGAPDLDTALNSSYAYDMEGNSNIPEVDLALTGTPIEAVPWKLRAKWSVEAANDYRVQFGRSAEGDLVGGVTAEIKYEIDRTVIDNVINLASLDIPQWSTAPGSGISYTEHKLSFIDELTKASNEIYGATGRAMGSWVVCGLNVANVIETLPGFKWAPGLNPDAAIPRGVVESGTLNGRWRVFKDTGVDANFYMVGYKGNLMHEVGYIYAPYMPIYTTPTYTLSDFNTQKGIGSRAGLKPVDSKFYCTSSIS